ncbi:hypothetical protein CR513_40343, partial [Mucuna pruriens]
MVNGWNDVSSPCVTGPLPSFSVCSPWLIRSRFPTYHRTLVVTPSRADTELISSLEWSKNIKWRMPTHFRQRLIRFGLDRDESDMVSAKRRLGRNRIPKNPPSPTIALEGQQWFTTDGRTLMFFPIGSETEFEPPLSETEFEPPLSEIDSILDRLYPKLMRKRFIPPLHVRDLHNKLYRLYQGSKRMDEYHKEMRIELSRAQLRESEKATMARLLHRVAKLWHSRKVRALGNEGADAIEEKNWRGSDREKEKVRSETSPKKGSKPFQG